MQEGYKQASELVNFQKVNNVGLWFFGPHFQSLVLVLVSATILVEYFSRS